jgi:hypothetical protein
MLYDGLDVIMLPDVILFGSFVITALYFVRLCGFFVTTVWCIHEFVQNVSILSTIHDNN